MAGFGFFRKFAV